MEIILSVAIAVLIFVSIYFILLLNDLRRTLQEVYFMLRDLHKDLNPILKNVEDLTKNSNEFVEELNTWAKELSSILGSMRFGKKIFGFDGKVISVLVPLIGLITRLVKKKSSKEGGNKS